MRITVAIVLAAACAEPVVEMQLMLPKNADAYDTSCITAVEVRVNGGNYANDDTDFTRSCMELKAGATYASVRDAIRGKFSVTIPDSGMSGIEVYGWSGPSACKESDNPFVTPDLLFFGKGDYIGQDRVDIPLTPNVSCTRNEVKLRMYDMFALIGGATCDVAGTIAGEGGAGIGTLVPRMFSEGSEFFGNLAGANMMGNLVTFTGPTQAGSKSCLAIDGGSDMTGGSTGCVLSGPSVCAAAGEIEHAIIPYSVLENAGNYDPALMVQFPGIIFGSVWTGGATKAPIGGATIEIDPAHGKVIYLDPPNAQGLLVARGGTSTGPSGLFALYTDTVASVKITANGQTKTVQLGATDDRYAAAMIVMGP